MLERHENNNDRNKNASDYCLQSILNLHQKKVDTTMDHAISCNVIYYRLIMFDFSSIQFTGENARSAGTEN